MESAPLMVSPSSDERLWSKLHDRVDTILEQRNPRRCSTSAQLVVESESGKRFREDSLLLIRGLDSAASSLSQLTNSLTAAQQNLSDLAKPSLTCLQQRESHTTEDKEAQPNPKRRCCSTELLNKDEGAGFNNTTSSRDEANVSNRVKPTSADVQNSGNLKKAKNLAISMASKATSLARELKMIKSELCFMQERCSLLEEENKRLRDGVAKGDRPEEDDLVRLQLEALLAEKSRLANENSTLTRENQCLHHLLDYHQLAAQDMPSPSYEEVIHGMCLDFSEAENSCDEAEFARTPPTDALRAASSLDEEEEAQ